MYGFVTRFTNAPVARLLAFAAVASLFLPILTPLSPGLAGWSASHGHIYAGGVPVPHTHPWEQAPGPAPAAAPVFHLCELHPDGIVPAPSGEASGAAIEDDTAAAAARQDVVFTFDQTLLSVSMLVPEPPVAPPLSSPWIAASTCPDRSLVSWLTSAPDPPPKA
ncbi:MAG: hypothetical protein R3B59_02625 [Dehalococcoidia bacterium]